MQIVTVTNRTPCSSRTSTVTPGRAAELGALVIAHDLRLITDVEVRPSHASHHCIISQTD